MNKKIKVFSASHWGTKRYLFGESWSTALSTWLQLCGATVLPGKGMYGTFVLYHRNGRLRKHNQQISNQLYGAYPSREVSSGSEKVESLRFVRGAPSHYNFPKPRGRLNT